jgi:hypothetical protein
MPLAIVGFTWLVAGVFLFGLSRVVLRAWRHPSRWTAAKYTI